MRSSREEGGVRRAGGRRLRRSSREEGGERGEQQGGNLQVVVPLECRWVASQARGSCPLQPPSGLQWGSSQASGCLCLESTFLSWSLCSGKAGVARVPLCAQVRNSSCVSFECPELSQSLQSGARPLCVPWRPCLHPGWPGGSCPGFPCQVLVRSLFGRYLLSSSMCQALCQVLGDC